MGIVIDIALVIFLIVSIFFGYRKGLVSLAMKLCAFIITIVVTFILYRPIANLIINVTSIDESIENSIYDKVTSDMKEKNDQDNFTSNLIESAKQGLLPQASRNLAINIVYVGVAIILFVVVRIAINFVTAIANIIAKLPIIKQFNEIGGAIYGTLRGIVIIYAILFVISFVGEISPNNGVVKTIDETKVTKVMYDNNVFGIFIK